MDNLYVSIVGTTPRVKCFGYKVTYKAHVCDNYTMELTDIRQSDEWSEYLKLYGWVSYKLSSGAVFRVGQAGPLRFGKLHRPAVLGTSEVAELQELAKKCKLTSLKISPGLDSQTDFLEQAGFKACVAVDLSPSTLVVDLELGEDELWRSFSKVCRWAINKSQRAFDRVEILQSPTRKHVEDYYRIVASRGAKKGFYVQSLQDQLRKVEVFKDKAFILNVYTKSGDILGTKLFLGFRDAIWYMHGGITDRGQKSTGGYLLIWESIKRFKTLGYKVFDFESVSDTRLKKLTKSWAGYTGFKLQFGGKLVVYPLPVVRYYGLLSILNPLV